MEFLRVDVETELNTFFCVTGFNVDPDVGIFECVPILLTQKFNF